MRIAMFSDSALPIINGVSLSIDALIRELRRQGHSVHLFTASFPNYEDPDPNTYRARAIITPWVPGYPMAIPPFYGLLKKFRRHRFDVIHTHTPFTMGFVGLRWAESHEIPIVSTYHTLYDRYAHYIPYIPRRYIRFKIAKHTSFYYNSVSHVICPSEAARKWLQRHSVDTPVTVIPTPVFERQMLDRPECRAKLGIAPGQKVMLYVGRLAKEKNLETLIQMASIAMRRDPSIRLILVGDGPHRTACLEMVRSLGIGDRVTFAGFVPRQEVDAFYAASDVFVFCSVTETQGLVVQEAMAYGLPAVAVVGGGAGENILNGENGFLVKNDAETFAEAVNILLSDDALYSKLAEGAKRFVGSRSPEATTAKVLQVYRGAISGEAVEEALEGSIHVR